MQKMIPIVQFTPIAQEKLSAILEEQKSVGSYLRIDLYQSAGGCACSGGYAYGMQLAEKPRTGDMVEEVGTFKVVTDMNNVEALRGSKIDFIEDDHMQGFKIENPNVQGQGCGCGGHDEHGESH